MIYAISQADVLYVLQWGGLALLALVLLFLLGAVIALLGLGAQWARKQFLLADAALVPLGQTAVGALVHDAVAGLESQVDQASDPYVQVIHSALTTVISGVVQAVVPQYVERARTLITPEQVQQFLLYLVTGAAELLDGAAASEADIPTRSYGVPEPDVPITNTKAAAVMSAPGYDAQQAVRQGHTNSALPIPDVEHWPTNEAGH